MLNSSGRQQWHAGLHSSLCKQSLQQVVYGHRRWWGAKLRGCGGVGNMGLSDEALRQVRCKIFEELQALLLGSMRGGYGGTQCRQHRLQHLITFVDMGNLLDLQERSKLILLSDLCNLDVHGMEVEEMNPWSHLSLIIAGLQPTGGSASGLW